MNKCFTSALLSIESPQESHPHLRGWTRATLNPRSSRNFSSRSTFRSGGSLERLTACHWAMVSSRLYGLRLADRCLLGRRSHRDFFGVSDVGSPFCRSWSRRSWSPRNCLTSCLTVFPISGEGFHTIRLKRMSFLACVTQSVEHAVSKMESWCWTLDRAYTSSGHLLSHFWRR